MSVKSQFLLFLSLYQHSLIRHFLSSFTHVFIDAQLIYSVVVVSGIQQMQLCTNTHTHTFFSRFFSLYRLLHNIEYSSVCYQQILIDYLFLIQQCVYVGVSLVAQLVKNPPAMWATWIQSLGQKDPWVRKIPCMATHSSILAWRIPMDKRAWQAPVNGVAKSQTQLSD